MQSKDLRFLCSGTKRCPILVLSKAEGSQGGKVRPSISRKKTLYFAAKEKSCAAVCFAPTVTVAVCWPSTS